MLDTFKQSIANQFEAAFCSLNACVDQCPATDWDSPVANYLFCQVAFHTLFFADYYLEPDEQSLRRQRFHLENTEIFRDYEELMDRAPQLRYDKASIELYMEHCRSKAKEVIASETVDSLCGTSGFERLKFSRAELHIYNIRHIQHHAAQLSLRLRIDHGQNVPWFGTGWREM